MPNTTSWTRDLSPKERYVMFFSQLASFVFGYLRVDSVGNLFDNWLSSG